MFSPKTGEFCHCKKGTQRDNCQDCEGTGMIIDFAAIRKVTAAHRQLQEIYEGTRSAAPTTAAPPPSSSVVTAAKMLGLPLRVIPTTALRPKVKQNDAPLELEQPGIDAKEPKLF